MIIPGRSSIAGRACTPRFRGACPISKVDRLGCRTVPSSRGSVITPIERNPSGAQAGAASGCAGDAVEDASVVGGVIHNFRQLNTWFEFSPWRRATSATDVPGRKASSTIRRFSSSSHERREAFTLSLVAVALGLSGNALNLHILSCATRRSAHYSLMDTCRSSPRQREGSHISKAPR